MTGLGLKLAKFHLMGMFPAKDAKDAKDA